MYMMEEELSQLINELRARLDDNEPWSESKAKKLQYLTSAADRLLQNNLKRYRAAKAKYSSLDEALRNHKT